MMMISDVCVDDDDDDDDDDDVDDDDNDFSDEDDDDQNLTARNVLRFKKQNQTRILRC